MLPDTAEYWLLGIVPSSFGVIGCMLNVMVAFLVLVVTPETPKEVKDLVDAMCRPLLKRKSKIKPSLGLILLSL